MIKIEFYYIDKSEKNLTFTVILICESLVQEINTFFSNLNYGTSNSSDIFCCHTPTLTY